MKKWLSVLWACLLLVSLSSCSPKYPKEGKWHCAEIDVCFESYGYGEGLAKLETGEIVEIEVYFDYGNGMLINYNTGDSVVFLYSGRYQFDGKKLTYWIREPEDVVTFHPCDGNCDLSIKHE